MIILNHNHIRNNQEKKKLLVAPSTEMVFVGTTTTQTPGKRRGRKEREKGVREENDYFYSPLVKNITHTPFSTRNNPRACVQQPTSYSHSLSYSFALFSTHLSSVENYHFFSACDDDKLVGTYDQVRRGRGKRERKGQSNLSSSLIFKFTTSFDFDFILLVLGK